MGLENRSTVSVYKRLQVRNNILCGTFLLCRSVHKDSSNNMNLYLVACLIVAASYKTEGCCTPCCIIGQQTIVECIYILLLDDWKLSRMKQTKYVRMYIEEFILVDNWIHCYASWNCTE